MLAQIDQSVADQGVSSLIQADASMLSIPSRLEWVGKAADFLKVRSVSSGACSEEKAGNLVLALYEAITNAIVHGNLGVPSSLKEESVGTFARVLAARSADPELASRRVGIRYCFDGTRCTIAITDQGAGFDFEKWIRSLETEPDAEEPARASGRGILMMRALVDQVAFRAGGREVELSVLADHAQATPAQATPAQATPAQATPAPSAEVDPRALLTTTRTPPPGEEAPSSPPPHSSAAAVMLLEQLHQPQDDPRRKHPRVAFTTSVEVRIPGEAFQTAFSRDLSRGGIALVAPFELPIGPIEVRVPIPGRDRQLMSARVVRCQRVTAGVFDIGCQFS